MLNLAKTDKANIIIDASQFDVFELCEARYYYSYVLHKGLPVFQKNRALDKGTILHEGFDIYYSLLKDGKEWIDRIEAMRLRVRALSSDPQGSNLDEEEVNHLLKAAEGSLEIFRWEDEMLEILAVEQPFAYVLHEDEFIRIIMSGKIDLLVNKPSFRGDSEWIGRPIDHKSYSRDSMVMRLSNQFQNYCAATGSMTLIVNRVGLHTSKKVEPSEIHKRIPLQYDPDMIQQWKTNTINVILERYANCVATGKWNMNYTSCLKFNRLCEFYEVCESSGQEAKDFKLANNYVENDPWDVTKNLEE